MTEINDFKLAKPGIFVDFLMEVWRNGVRALLTQTIILESNDFSWGEKIGKYPYSAGFVGPD